MTNFINQHYKKIKDILDSVHYLENNANLAEKCKIPNSAYFLDDKNILCYEDQHSNSRYHYANDGRILTTYATGGVCLQEGIFNIILPSFEGKESNLAFFVGKKSGNYYFPVSIFSNSKQLIEDSVKRFVVFSPESAYYFVEDDGIISTLKIFLDANKNVRCSFYVENVSGKTLSLYSSAYFNCFLWARECDNQWTKAYAGCKKEKDGYLFNVYENVKNGKIMHYAKVLRSSHFGDLKTTTSQICFKGGKNNPLTASTSLKYGAFDKTIDFTCYKENPIAGDIITFDLSPNEIFNVNYTLSCGDNEEFLNSIKDIEGELNDVELAFENNVNVIGKNIPLIKFSDATGEINDYTFNCLIANVLRQVETCAKSKNFAGQYLGMRDVFQQLESALLWCPEYSKTKITEAISFIFDDGRPPRQFSYPQYKGALPSLITSCFIDQGLWIIHTIYKYLAYTGDFSILDNKCGYYKFNGKVDFSDRFDTVLEHVTAIIEYLISNLDYKTGCLKILDGDWNDSLNGLGATTKPNSKFGTGVSVMATLQLYQALFEVADIFDKVGDIDKRDKYSLLRKKLGENILKYTIVSNGDDRKILHGWGDERSYFVGSYCDSDGLSRDSLTSVSFFILSGAINLDKTLSRDILKSFGKLDAKYGLNTFAPAFNAKSKGVGRIANMIEGTAENGATYNHSTLFGIWALLEMGEYKLAWKYIKKVIPITHDKITTSPFIMSNSYVYNEKLGLDGESGGDWYTGSACVLIKVLVYKIFGVLCSLNGIEFSPCMYLPFKNAILDMQVRGKKVTVEYITDNNLQDGIYLSSLGKKERIELYSDNKYLLGFDDFCSDLIISVINYHKHD
ncbi:MAG: hypothetical protein J6U92_02220 [Clostridia bacterium]|nr:hypothetical protein [Clostridia bacterium]